MLAGSSGRATWFAERASATASSPINHGMLLGSRNSSISHGNSSYSGLEEEFLGRQSTRQGAVGAVGGVGGVGGVGAVGAVGAVGGVGAVGTIGQGIPNSPIPGIPGAWYWQHDVPGYRGREEPPPIPLSDQYRFHLAWEAGFRASRLHGLTTSADRDSNVGCVERNQNDIASLASLKDALRLFIS